MGNKNGDTLFHGTKGNPQTSLEQEEFAINITIGQNIKEKPKKKIQKEEIAKIVKLKRDELMAIAKTDEVKEIINQLYRPGAKIGDGGTADALRYEIKKGVSVGNKSHLVKAEQRINQMNNILKKNPNHQDKALLEKLRDDLIDAINTKKEKK